MPPVILWILPTVMASGRPVPWMYLKIWDWLISARSLAMRTEAALPGCLADSARLARARPEGVW